MRTSGEVSGSPSPVMTLSVAGHWLAVPVEQMDRIAVAARVWPVPLARPEHLGLFDDAGDLVPILRLMPDEAAEEPASEQLVALLHVRGETVGLAVDAAGQVYDGYYLRPHEEPPLALAEIGAESAAAQDQRFWLVDPDRLWRQAAPTPTQM